MRKISVAEMRNVEGGAYRCKTCKKNFWFMWTAGYHILFYPGHKF